MKREDLNKITYSNNIRLEDLLYVRYKKLRISVSKHALNELLKHNLCLEDVKQVLEKGKTSQRKRDKNTIEKWLILNKKILEVVVVKNYDEILKQDELLLIHCGIFSNKKLIKRKEYEMS